MFLLHLHIELEREREREVGEEGGEMRLGRKETGVCRQGRVRAVQA